jgi:hypothetical protein
MKAVIFQLPLIVTKYKRGSSWVFQDLVDSRWSFFSGNTGFRGQSSYLGFPQIVKLPDCRIAFLDTMRHVAAVLGTGRPLTGRHGGNGAVGSRGDSPKAANHPWHNCGEDLHFILQNPTYQKRWPGFKRNRQKCLPKYHGRNDLQLFSEGANASFFKVRRRSSDLSRYWEMGCGFRRGRDCYFVFSSVSPPSRAVITSMLFCASAFEGSSSAIFSKSASDRSKSPAL